MLLIGLVGGFPVLHVMKTGTSKSGIVRREEEEGSKEQGKRKGERKETLTIMKVRPANREINNSRVLFLDEHILREALEVHDDVGR